jgi:hypothetical protein
MLIEQGSYIAYIEHWHRQPIDLPAPAAADFTYSRAMLLERARA